MRETPSSLGLTTATARAILGPDAGTAGRAEHVAGRLGEAIRLGLLLDGERLPAEPQLAEQFGVATVTLREALAVLRAQGLVVTRRGRGGGSFVRLTPAEPSDSLPDRLRRLSTQDIRELGDQRGAVSGTAARLAAERALPDEVEGLRQQAQRLSAATSASERRRADTQFTIEVAAAAQSSRLTAEEIRLRAEIGDLLWLHLSDADHAASVRSRVRLVDAIGRRDARRARALAEKQVATDTERLLRLRLTLPDPPSTVPSVPLDGEAERALLAAVEATVDGIFAALDPLAESYRELVAGRGADLEREDMAALRPRIFDLLEQHAGLVAGAGVIAAPGTLSDSHYWMEWWWTRASGAPEALRVNLDPSAPDFFDYPTAEWYAVPEQTRARHVAGPYVDYACTNEYALTVVVPVHLADRFIGIAAADLPVARLESHVLPALLALPRPMALVNAAGRVIASGSPRLFPGMLAGPPDDTGGAENGSHGQPHPDAGPTAGWRLAPVG
ncbi:MAG: GntR family transcriptional regulator [Blastococcus sp.]